MMQMLKKRLGTSVILITHDLGVVAEICDSVAVVYAGEIIEYGTAEDIFDRTSHPYTIGLFGSLPRLSSNERRLKPIKGLMPDPSKIPEGCPFAERCPHAADRCLKASPKPIEVEPGHMVKCFLAEKG